MVIVAPFAAAAFAKSGNATLGPPWRGETEGITWRTRRFILLFQPEAALRLSRIAQLRIVRQPGRAIVPVDSPTDADAFSARERSPLQQWRFRQSDRPGLRAHRHSTRPPRRRDCRPGPVYLWPGLREKRFR